MANILVVDDEPNVRRLLRVTVGPAHCIDEAGDGRQALERLFTHRTDLVVLDVAMPGMDGLAVCRAVRAEPSLAHIGIIVLSAFANRDAALAAGADRHLRKPFRPLELLGSIDELLGTDDRSPQTDSSRRMLRP